MFENQKLFKILQFWLEKASKEWSIKLFEMSKRKGSWNPHYEGYFNSKFHVPENSKYSSLKNLHSVLIIVLGYDLELQ